MVGATTTSGKPSMPFSAITVARCFCALRAMAAVCRLYSPFTTPATNDMPLPRFISCEMRLIMPACKPQASAGSK
jgi:hypothetical protein